MAKDKKSFILYAELLQTFEELSNEEAGILIKHILRYVNDLNPDAPDRLTKLLFTPIKNTLKRDLVKYEETKSIKSTSGKLGNLKRWNLDLYDKVISKELTIEEAENVAKNRICDNRIANVAVNDNVNVNVNDNDNEYKKKYLSEIKISDYPELNKSYFDISISFQELFKNNLKEAGASTSKIEKAKGIWVDDIRMIIEIDKYTVEDLQQAYKFLQVNEFWKKNILSTAKLREKMDKIKLELKNSNGSKQKHTTDDIQAIVKAGAALAAARES